MKTAPRRARSFVREVHVVRPIRDRFQLDSSLFSYRGGLVTADIATARRLAHDLNASRDISSDPQMAVRASDLSAYGLIEEIYHHVVDLYRDQVGKDLFARALSAAEERLSRERANGSVTEESGGALETLRAFVEMFPPTEVYAGESGPEEYLEDARDGERGSEVALEETLMVWLGNENPATEPFQELFADDDLAKRSSYDELVDATRRHLAREPKFERTGMSLIDTLLEPIRTHPDSLLDQLEFIRTKWGGFLGSYLLQMLRTLDFLKEEHRVVFGGPGPARVYEFSGFDEETERFSPDRDWMPQVVILAKSTFVWLDQLSRTYGREITRLDQIPDEELDEIAERGFTGLWFIGLWERSEASRRIKHITGNPDATASAYSLTNYEIADELGGWDALVDLRKRLARRGVRIASDMVPNHTGLDSDWMQRHPDWFLQLDHAPYPNYSFTGENLSNRDGLEVYLEDHYYDRTDAAVVFKRRNPDTGEERYIYHGNDGTGMPWNDTAQLDFLKKEVREATVQTILHVARNFPIIRFDAAMVLAKKHFYRLWYPEPGSGGDIPTRAEHGLTREQFDAAFPVEFWREVVDRVAEEVPDTLLLAEAFWMMEGYFVRTLGMHRVYNSAFMNMLKQEENAKYRQTIKNTISFDKQILKRFVNFMNNPDEETAVAQFGTDDKYFGVCTLMVTMPGLPMFGHGQIEGFTEKYGMEYRRALLDESVNTALVERHEREIFPLMKLRHLFAEVDNFLLFDFRNDHGGVNEDVYAYSNRNGGEAAFVFYNNKYEQARGSITESAEYAERVNDEKVPRRTTLAETLRLTDTDRSFCLLFEHRTRRWFIRRSSEIWNDGLHVALNGFETQVFTNIHEVTDDDQGNYRALHDYLNGAGMSSIELAFQEMRLKPVYDALRGMVASPASGALAHALYQASRQPEATAGPAAGEETPEGAEEILTDDDRKQIMDRFTELLSAIESVDGYRVDGEASTERAAALIDTAVDTIESAAAIPEIRELAGEQQIPEIAVVPYLVFRAVSLSKARTSILDVIHEWLLYRVFEEQMSDDVRYRLNHADWRTVMDLLLTSDDVRDGAEPAGDTTGKPATTGARGSTPATGSHGAAGTLEQILTAPAEREYALVHEYEGTVWFDRTRFRTLLFWRWLSAHMEAALTGSAAPKPAALKRVLAAEKKSGYQLEAFREALASKKGRKR